MLNQQQKIKKVNEKVYAAQARCEKCKGPHYTKDCPDKEDRSTMEEAFYTKFDTSYPQGRFKAVAPGSYEWSILKDDLPRKGKDLGSFTLPCFINNTCFNNALTNFGANRTMKHPKGIAVNVLVGIDRFTFPVDFVVLYMPEDVKTPLILGRSFLSTAMLRLMRVYALSLEERMELNLEARLMGEALMINRSEDTDFGDFIELNDLNEPLELRRDQNMDSYRDEEMGDVIAGKQFCKEIGVNAKWFEGMITIYNGNNEITYPMSRSHLRFKHLTNKQCNEIRPILKISAQDLKEGISYPYQKLKKLNNGVLNLGPEYIKDEEVKEWLTRGHIRMHEMEW
ncbi:hypothetical protein Tco_1043251 [Tanacetum coccineum]|uniref:Uncharacterized protein n=1 Tax=Tanacetum coccineum TaxID=301880 RepID=A0ABQ5GMS3_9ASTR